MTGGAFEAAGELAWVVTHAAACVLVFARVLGMVWTAPGCSTPGVDVRLRLVLALGLSAILAPMLGPGLLVPADWSAVARGVVTELLVGAAIGWSASLVIAGARQAGEIVGAQAGLSPAALLDPDAGDGLTPLGHLYGLLALATFLVLDGPLALVRALCQSYRVIPAGGVLLSDETVMLAFGRVGKALELTLQAAAPVALAVALAGLALGLIGRLAPSLPLAALSMPVRAALGVALVVLGLTTLVATLAAAWSALSI
jgi:flagellar biosynthesis protein FliR